MRFNSCVNISLMVVFCLIDTSTVQAGAFDEFANAQSKTVEDLVVAAFNSSKNMNLRVAQGRCDSTELSVFEADLKNLATFEQRTETTLQHNFSGSDPESVGAQQIAKSSRRAWRGAISAIKLGTAEFALEAGCLGLADRYYRDVIDFDSTDAYVRKAMIGVEDVREKRRSGAK
jgi:hypothetical protein